MFKLFKVELLTLLIAYAFLTRSGHDGTFVSRKQENNLDHSFTEKSFIQSRILGNCCLVAGMATLPGNSELRHQVLPSNLSKSQESLQFNIHRTGELHRAEVDVKSLPTTGYWSELVYSSSANGDMVGPLLEKALVDVLYGGEYESSEGACPSTVLASFNNGLYEQFPIPSYFGLEIVKSAVEHGLKSNSPMVVAFGGKLEGLYEEHCYTLLDVKNGTVKLYNPHGSYLQMTESDFYESLERLDVAYYKNKIFRMPRVEASFEFNETWPALRRHEKVRFVAYDLSIDDNDTEVLVNFLAKKSLHEPEDLYPKLIIVEVGENGHHWMVRNNSVAGPSKFNNKMQITYTKSLRAVLDKGRYLVAVALSPGLSFFNTASCDEYLRDGGGEFLFRLAASKRCSVGKAEEAKIIEEVFTDWEMGKIKN